MAEFNITAHSERGEEHFTCTGDNTELYLHADQYAEVNHIFHRYDSVERALGAFCLEAYSATKNLTKLPTT